MIFSFSISLTATARSRLMTSNWRAFSTRSYSTATAPSRFFSATCTSRLAFSLAMPISCSEAMRAPWAIWFCSASTLCCSAISRARVVAISRPWRASASACWRSSASMASLASTSCFLIVFSASRWISLAFILWMLVRSMIFLRPSLSKMLSGSSILSGVCSR